MSSSYDSEEETSIEATPAEGPLTTGSFVRTFTATAVKPVYRWYGPVRVPDKDAKVS